MVFGSQAACHLCGAQKPPEGYQAGLLEGNADDEGDVKKEDEAKEGEYEGARFDPEEPPEDEAPKTPVPHLDQRKTLAATRTRSRTRQSALKKKRWQRAWA